MGITHHLISDVILIQVPAQRNRIQSSYSTLIGRNTVCRL